MRNDISLENVRLALDDSSYIDNDLVLFSSFKDIPLATEPRKMHCLLVALCMEGSARYVVDTKEHVMRKNDVIILNNGQVIGNYMLSPDCKGVAIMTSNDFFAES